MECGVEVKKSEDSTERSAGLPSRSQEKSGCSRKGVGGVGGVGAQWGVGGLSGWLWVKPASGRSVFGAKGLSVPVV